MINSKKVKKANKKLILRTEEYLINIRSKNYPKLAEAAMMAGVVAASVATAKTRTSLLR